MRENKDMEASVSTTLIRVTSWQVGEVSPEPPDAVPGFDGTLLLAVFTFGGMKRICLPSSVFRLPMPFTMIGFGEDDADDKVEIGILICLPRNGELTAALGTVIVADVVALLIRWAYAAAVSRSLPPPTERNSLISLSD